MKEKNETFFYIIRKDSHHYARGKTKLSPYSVYFLYRKCYYRIVISEVLKDYAAKIVEIKVLERCVQQLINMLHCFSEFYIVIFISFLKFMIFLIYFLIINSILYPIFINNFVFFFKIRTLKLYDL